MAELEYDHTMTSYECRMGWAVDLSKTNFQGRSSLEIAKDNATRTLISIILPSEGESEFDGLPLYSSGKEIGHVTMAVLSLYLEGRFLGLARINRKHSRPGNELELAGGFGGKAKAVSTPVYDPAENKNTIIEILYNREYY